MQPTKGHRKLVKHDDQPGEAHELTFSCFGRRQLLRLNSRCRLLAESVDRAMHTQHYELLAYVFMPEHVHLLVLPNENAIGISKLLFAINRPFSFRVKQQMIKESDPMLSVLTIRDRPNHTSFRFWQEGPGYDRNIRNTTSLHDVIDYIHRNPTRRKLVDHPSSWRWSSWHAYEEEESNAPTRPSVSVWSKGSHRRPCTGGQADQWHARRPTVSQQCHPPIKRPFSFRVKQQMIKESDPMLSVLTIRDRPNRLMGDTFSDQLNPKSLQSHPRIFHLTRIALFLVLPSSIVR